MVDLNIIKENYPENLQVFDRFILREYLQYKILQIIFETEYGKNLCFLGGTALRIVYGNNRFSEDLDFDNFGLSQNDFESLVMLIGKKLELEGYEIETRNVFKGAYRCYLKFPRLLHKLGLSGYEDEKVLIQLDATKQEYKYLFDKILLNKFDVFTHINVAPKDVLLSKKVSAALGRKTLKGRDFFDIVFLFSFTSPNYDYLSVENGISNLGELKTSFQALLKDVDMGSLALDVSAFLFNPAEIKRITFFKEFLKQLK